MTVFTRRSSLHAKALASSPTLVALTVLGLACGGSTGVSPAGAPHIDLLTPATATTGGPQFPLVVTGTGFTSMSMIRWNGVARSAISNGPPITTLTTVILSSDLPASGSIPVEVVNPGGAISNSVAFTMMNPPPVMNSVSPTSGTAGSGATSITIFGSAFTTMSVGRWNGSPRATTFVSATQLSMALTAADMAVGGIAQITVTTPAPGGGVTAPASFTVNNPYPVISSLSPAYVATGAAPFTLTVTGTSFVNGSIVRWNGADRATSYVSATQLTAAVPASDLTTLGTASVTVFSPTPGGGTSRTTPFTIGISSLLTIGVQANDLVYDAGRKRLYASIGQTAPSRANTIARIDPLTGTVDATVAVAGDPGRIALSADGLYLYVGLKGAGTVVRVDLGTFTVGTQFSLGTDVNFGTRYVQDLAVLPGASTSIAVARAFTTVSPATAGVAIYDNGVARTTTTPPSEIDDLIAFGAGAGTLYSLDNETTSGNFRRLSVSASGVTQASAVTGLVQQSFGVTMMRYANGRIYLNNGQLIDPVAGTSVGVCTTGTSFGAVQPDSVNNRAILLDGTVPVLRACDATTFASRAVLTVPGVSGNTGALTRWETDGIAFAEGASLVILRTSLVTQ